MKTVFTLIIAMLCVGCSHDGNYTHRVTPTNAELEGVAGEPVIAVRKKYCVLGNRSQQYGTFLAKVQDRYNGNLSVYSLRTNEVCAFSSILGTVPVPVSFLKQEEEKKIEKEVKVIRKIHRAPKKVCAPIAKSS